MIKGQAQVVWVRKETAGLSHPAGMGVRFLELEGASQSLIETVVDKLRKKGRAPFDVDSDEARAETAEEQLSSIAEITGEGKQDSSQKAASAGGAAVADLEAYALAKEMLSMPESSPVMSEPPPEVEVAVAPRRILRIALLTLIAIGVGFIIVLLFNYFYIRPRIDELERRLDSLSAGTGNTGASGGQITEDGVEIAAPDVEDPLTAVTEWARAWSEQRVDDYLGAYSSQFEPEGEMSRQEWEALRRTRILRASGIQVQVLLAEETQVGPGERLVSFVQAYRSRSYQDRVRKVLRLVWEDGAWKIAEERVARALPD